MFLDSKIGIPSVLDIRVALYFRCMQDLPTFFEKFEYGQFEVLSEESHHHARHVLRLQEGDTCYIVNGQGTRLLVRIAGADKKQTRIDVLEEFQEVAAKQKLSIGVSFTKNPARMEWFLEKATEVGIHEIIPLMTRRSERPHFKRERFEKILISAMLQSRQTYLPVLHEPTALSTVIQGSNIQGGIAHCMPDEAKINMRQFAQPDQHQLILIGPEGDFSPEEIEESKGAGFKAITLGTQRLRTETAALVAVVQWHQALME